MMRPGGESGCVWSSYQAPAFAIVLLAAATAACTDTLSVDEARERLHRICANHQNPEASVAALVALSRQATEQDRLGADQMLEAAHHEMIAEPQTFPLLPYLEALYAHPRFTTLVGIANGKLRTANRLDGAKARRYLEQSACMFHLAKLYDAEKPEHQDDPQHGETLYSIDMALECAETRLKAATDSGTYCHEAIDTATVAVRTTVPS